MKNYFINLKEQGVKAIFNNIEPYFEMGQYKPTMDGLAIMAMVKKFSEGFVTDICERFSTSTKWVMSDKQRWCVAFAFIKLTDEQIEAYCNEVMA